MCVRVLKPRSKATRHRDISGSDGEQWRHGHHARSDHVSSSSSSVDSRTGSEQAAVGSMRNAPTTAVRTSRPAAFMCRSATFRVTLDVPPISRLERVGPAILRTPLARGSTSSSIDDAPSVPPRAADFVLVTHRAGMAAARRIEIETVAASSRGSATGAPMF